MDAVSFIHAQGRGAVETMEPQLFMLIAVAKGLSSDALNVGREGIDRQLELNRTLSI